MAVRGAVAPCRSTAPARRPGWTSPIGAAGALVSRSRTSHRARWHAAPCLGVELLPPRFRKPNPPFSGLASSNVTASTSAEHPRRSAIGRSFECAGARRARRAAGRHRNGPALRLSRPQPGGHPVRTCLVRTRSVCATCCLITGDPGRVGDYPDATAVFDVDSIGLTNLVTRLNHGGDIGGQPIGAPTAFHVGCRQPGGRPTWTRNCGGSTTRWTPGGRVRHHAAHLRPRRLRTHAAPPRVVAPAKSSLASSRSTRRAMPSSSPTKCRVCAPDHSSNGCAGQTVRRRKRQKVSP